MYSPSHTSSTPYCLILCHSPFLQAVISLTNMNLTSSLHIHLSAPATGLDIFYHSYTLLHLSKSYLRKTFQPPHQHVLHTTTLHKNHSIISYCSTSCGEVPIFLSNGHHSHSSSPSLSSATSPPPNYQVVRILNTINMLVYTCCVLA